MDNPLTYEDIAQQMLYATDDSEIVERVFYACVKLLETGASWLGTDYRTINVWVFCLIWPAVTLLLLMWAMYERKRRKMAEWQITVAAMIEAGRQGRLPPNVELPRMP